MKSIKEQWALQIDVTSKCNNRCSNCTHLCPHTCNQWEMDYPALEKAIIDTKDYPNLVGVIGGNPSLLSMEKIKFITDTFNSVGRPKSHRGWWTNNFMSQEKEDYIRANYGYINFNPHAEPVEHSMVLVSSQSVIPDPVERKRVRDKCWLQDKWSGSITPKGLYFCEVAGSMDMVLNANLGHPGDKWRDPISSFKDQIDYFCDRCGVCMQLKGRMDKERRDDMTLDNIQLFGVHASPRVLRNEYEVFDLAKAEYSNDPWKYIVSMKNKENK